MIFVHNGVICNQCSIHMMVELKLVVSIVYFTILTIAGILGIVSLGLFADAYNDYKNDAANVVTDYCFLFLNYDQESGLATFAPNEVCHFVVAADVIALLLILASGVAMVTTFIIVKYVL